MEGLWIDEMFVHLISLEEKMRPIPKISEADAIVLAGIYSLDVSNFVPGQRTR
jgi:hypothetical protein